MNENRVLDISWSSIFKIGIAALSFYILYLIRNILIWFIFALIISFLFNPAINFLEKRKLPRIVAVIFIYGLFIVLISFLIYSTASIFIQEIQNFSQSFPQYFEKILPLMKIFGIKGFEDTENFLLFLNKSLEKMAISLPMATIYLFGGVLSTFFLIAFAIFLSLEAKQIEKGILFLFPKKYENYVLYLWHKSQKKVSGWFLSRIVACFFVGILSLVAFLIFRIKYPFTLSLLAGALNFIPFIGPVITGILIFVLASLDSLEKAVFAVLAFILIQQIENNIITPILVRRFVELSPTLVLLSLAIGGKLFGLWGTILVIPLVGILFEFFKDYLKKRREETF